MIFHDAVMGLLVKEETRAARIGYTKSLSPKRMERSSLSNIPQDGTDGAS
jgi:hypothetical protein